LLSAMRPTQKASICCSVEGLGTYLKRYFLRRATHLVMTGGLFKNTTEKSKKWLEN
jgi:hypothetical protein